jgi:uncharacterized protein YaaQ
MMHKMIMAVVPRDEAYHVLEGLVAAGFTATFSESRGGVMRQAQLTFFIAVDEANLEQVLDIIRANCRMQVKVESHRGAQGLSLGPAPVTAEVGGAVIFIWDLDRYLTC